MFKKLVLLMLLSVSAISINAEKNNLTYNKLEQVITSAWIPAYSVDQIFAKPIKQDDLNRWNEAVSALQTFSKEKGHNSSTINHSMNGLANLANTIENSVKIANNTKAINKSSRSENDALADILEKLQEALGKAIKSNIALNKESFFFYTKDRKEVKNLQNILLEVLTAISEKVIKDALTYKAPKEQPKNVHVNKAKIPAAFSKSKSQESNEKFDEFQDIAKRTESRDPYKILGVKPGATRAEINKAYKDLALKYHPDKLAGTSEANKKIGEEFMKALSNARKVLLSPDPIPTAA